MDQLVEYWIPVAAIVGTFFGACIAPIIGYFKKPRNGGSSVHGAAIMDSNIGHSIAHELKRLAKSAERIEGILEERAASEREEKKVSAAVEAAKAKWNREHKD